jgi:hypothetical protein
MVALLILIFLLLIAMGIYYALRDPWKKWFWLSLAIVCLFNAADHMLKSEWGFALIQSGWMLLFLRLWWVRSKVI